jgi:hypothetical protein
VLILRLYHHRWSLPLVKEEEDDGMQWRTSWCPLSGMPLPSVLSRSGSNEEWNDLSQILLPPKVRHYPLYTEIGRVHSGLGGSVYGLLVPESRRVLQQRSLDRGSVMELKKPWVLSSCSVLTLCMSCCVGLDRPPLDGPSGVFLVATEVGS